MKMHLLNTAPAAHDYRLIAVAEQEINIDNPFEIDTLRDGNGNWYDVLEHYTYNHGESYEPFRNLMLLATGQYIDQKQIWDTYPVSARVFIFLVKKRS